MISGLLFKLSAKYGHWSGSASDLRRAFSVHGHVIHGVSISTTPCLSVFTPEWVLSSYGASLDQQAGQFCTRYFVNLLAGALTVSPQAGNHGGQGLRY